MGAVSPVESAWKGGRCLLASSHAGTRLPIAEIQDSGRSPSVRHIGGSRFPLSQKIKNRRIPFVVSSCNRASMFPTAALSASGIRVEGDSFLSACPNKLPCMCSCKIKTGETFCGFSCKKSVHDDFLRRHYPHQVKGRSSITSSQPAHTSSPVFQL